MTKLITSKMGIKGSVPIIMVLIFLFIASVGIAYAESEWYCETCEETRTTSWCPICGAHRPESEGETWICPFCGQEWPDEFNFCPDDRTEKTTSSGSWPALKLHGCETGIWESNKTRNRQARFGPDRDYPGAGLYSSSEIIRVTALFQEGDSVLTDIETKGGGKRCVYFESKVLKEYDVESLKLTAYPAKIAIAVQPSFGPGENYELVQNKRVSQKTGQTLRDDVILPEGTNIDVFFETDEWLFAEFTCVIGKIRAWIPVDCLVEK